MIAMPRAASWRISANRSEEHTSELQSQSNLVCRLLLEKKKKNRVSAAAHTTARRARSTSSRMSRTRDPSPPAPLPCPPHCCASTPAAGSLPRSALESLPVFFFNDTATTEIYTLSLHDALPIWRSRGLPRGSD